MKGHNLNHEGQEEILDQEVLKVDSGLMIGQKIGREQALGLMIEKQQDIEEQDLDLAMEEMMKGQEQVLGLKAGSGQQKAEEQKAVSGLMTKDKNAHMFKDQTPEKKDHKAGHSIHIIEERLIEDKDFIFFL